MLSIVKTTREIFGRPRGPRHDITFRQLGEEDADAIATIENKIIARNPEKARLGHIHPQSRQLYASLLDKEREIKFIGAFVKENGHEKLVGYAASKFMHDPNDFFWVNPFHPHVHQLVDSEKRRSISLPRLRNRLTNGIEFFYLWRVDPDYQHDGVGTALCAAHIAGSIGKHDRDAPDFMISETALTNAASLRSQFGAGRKTGATTLIWAAGFDHGASDVPSVALIQTKEITYSGVPVLYSTDIRSISGEHFADFSALLDAGYVAWIKCESSDPSAWRVCIAKRPDCFAEFRPKGEMPAGDIQPAEVARRLGGAKSVNGFSQISKVAA